MDDLFPQSLIKVTYIGNFVYKMLMQILNFYFNI